MKQLDSAFKFKLNLLKILGLKWDSEENQGSIFDVKWDYEYSDMIKLVWEIVADKEKLRLGKFALLYRQVYELTSK